MKLRIRGDSVRLRVSQGELTQFLERGEVSDRIRFPGGASLAYRLLRDEAAQAVSANLKNDAITVSVPVTVAERWAEPDEVGFRGEGSLGSDSLAILVEKDFTCLAPREGEDDSDLFPNPRSE